MLKDAELIQVRTYVIKVLPELLRADPEVATTIEGIVAQHFPRRDEFARLLDEMTAARLERQKELEKHQVTVLNHVQAATGEQINELRVATTLQIEEVRTEIVEQLGQQREETQAQFTQLRTDMDECFTEQRQETQAQFTQLRSEMDERFAEQRQETQAQFTELRTDMDQRFEQVDQRFEQVDQRFEQVDQHFKQVDRSLLELRRDVTSLRHGQDMIIKRMDDQHRWLQFTVGDLRAEKGQTLEDVVAAALRFGLKNPDIRPESIRLRQRLLDPKRRFFRMGSSEIDLIAMNGKLIVFEVKSTVKISDVDLFDMKIGLVAEQNPDQEVSGVLIALGAREEIRERCQALGITLAD